MLIDASLHLKTSLDDWAIVVEFDEDKHHRLFAMFFIRITHRTNTNDEYKSCWKFMSSECIRRIYIADNLNIFQIDKLQIFIEEFVVHENLDMWKK